MNKTLVVICGPTAVGKTKVAIELAKEYCTEIISADSRQIFKELSIGTAVPDEHDLREVKHYFIHNKSIFDSYNASIYENEVLNLLNEIYKEKDIAFLAGGSGLYIDAVCHGIDDLPEIDSEIRDYFKDKLKYEGLESLRLELKRVDPDFYSMADLKNPKRILKALEVHAMTNRPYSSLLTKTKKERTFKILLIGLDIERDKLYQRINERVEKMVENGLIEEAKKWIDHRDLNSLNTVGYKEIFDYLEGKISLTDAIDLIKRNTRKYARRQLTWFRRYDKLKWFSPDETIQIKSHIQSFLSERNG